jgi:hypothetical protein
MDEDRKKSLKERAKEARKAAYQKAKERNKAFRESLKSSPAAIERAARLKERRRAAYQKAKEAHKAKTTEKKARDRREQDEAKALTDEEVLATLVTTADKLEKTEKPSLRLIRGEG